MSEIAEVFILGAGASFGARCNDADEVVPPLGDGLGPALDDFYTANAPENIDDDAREASESLFDETMPSPDLWDPEIRQELAPLLLRLRTENFEAVMNDITPREWQLQAHLNRLLAFALLTGIGTRFPERPDRFDTLFSRRTGQIAIVTVNYDILVEEALTRLGLDWHYVGIGAEGVANSIPIFKPHGSASWIMAPGPGTGSSIAMARANTATARFRLQQGDGFEALGMDNGRDHALTDRANAVLELKHPPRRHSILATYGRGKTTTHGVDVRERVAVKANALLSATKNAACTIIGVRPTTMEDDPILHKIIVEAASSSKKKVYVSPVATERDEMANRGYEPFAGGLAEYMATRR